MISKISGFRIASLCSLYLGAFALYQFGRNPLADREVLHANAALAWLEATTEGLSGSPHPQFSAAPALIENRGAGVEKPGAEADILLRHSLLPGIDIDLTGARDALNFYKSGDLSQGDRAAKLAPEKIVQIALEWVALHNFPREAGFDRLIDFMQAHPDWPAAQWLQKRAEEALYGDHKPTAVVRSFFAGKTPLTVSGKLALARADAQDGLSGNAAASVRTIWREDDLNLGLETKIRAEFGTYLAKSDYKFRADRLIYKDENASALRAAAWAGPDVTALARYRIAAKADLASDALLNTVPLPLKSDPGVIFARIQKLRHVDKIREASALLLSAPRDPLRLVNGDEWWVERRIIARKMLDLGEAETAYRICKEHNAHSRESQMEAEFHAGWIALRFLHDPERAARHFETLAKLAETPISTARAAYWQGRAAEASHDPGVRSLAGGFYAKASDYPAAFYGQLARGKLGLPDFEMRDAGSEAKGADRQQAVRVIELLYALGEKDQAASLVNEAAQHISDPSQLAALAKIIGGEKDAPVSLRFGKLVNQRGFALDALAYPDYGVPPFQPLQHSADRSIIYAIARQESAFDPKASSPAGAKGLMQMIVSTAKRTAERAGVAFDELRLLSDAAFNAQLGAEHLGQLLVEQKGSYILAFAAYNAGGKHVKEWIDTYGDPRSPGVDVVDWIERIPFSETRNYVQRVVENLVVYRARFGENAAALDNLGGSLSKSQARL